MIKTKFDLKRDVICIMFLLFVFLSVVITPKQIKAAGITSYITGSTSSYDLNGDGKRDTVKVIQPGKANNYRGILYINGNKVYQFPNSEYFEGCGFQIITLKNGKRFVLFSGEGPNPGISDDILFQYTKHKKAKKIFSFYSALKKFGGAGMIRAYNNGVSVSGNSVIVHYEKMLWTSGAITLKFTFKYKNGTLVRSSNTDIVDSTRMFNTSKKVQTYKTVSTKNKSVAFAKNTVVSIAKYYLKGKVMWLQLKDTKGRTGWIKCLTKNPGTGRSPIFSNGYYSN